MSSTAAWSAAESADIACSPPLRSREPGTPKPANPPIRSIFSVLMALSPGRAASCADALQPDLLPSCVNCASDSSVARIQLSSNGTGAIGKGLHLHGGGRAEAGLRLVPDLADLFPAVAADRLRDDVEGEVRDAAAHMRIHAGLE